MKRVSRRVALALSVLALAALPFGQWAATAHTQTYQANLSIHFDKHADSIWGHVGTSSFCQENRTVEVFKNGSSIGTTLSGHAGMWSVASQGSGDYYATVAESHTVGYDHDHTCLGDTSTTTTVS